MVHHESEYMTIAKRKVLIAASIDKYKAIYPALNPLEAKSEAIGQTWWGRAWVQHLRRIKVPRTKMSRGSFYLRHGCVIDLALQAPYIMAMVQGSQTEPYHVMVKVKPVSLEQTAGITAWFEKHFTALSDLEKSMVTDVTKHLYDPKLGLLPLLEDLDWTCSCKDKSKMCKHVASALLGCALIFDESPQGLLDLRQVAYKKAAHHHVKKHVDDLLAHRLTQTDRQVDLPFEVLFKSTKAPE